MAIGEVADYGESFDLSNIEQPFILEKYISINGTKYSSTSAVELIMSNSDLKLSLIQDRLCRVHLCF